MESKHSLRKSKLFRALLILLLIAVPVQWAAAQLTLSTPRTTLGTVIKQIQSQSKYQFFYNDKLSTVTVEPLKVKDASLEQVLNTLLKNKDISYKIEENIIYLSEKENSDSLQQQSGKERTITGQVVDAKGEPLIGVSILVKGTTDGAITDLDGNYKIVTKSNNPVIVYSYIGYKTQEIPLKGQTAINITMMDDTQVIDEVVVTALYHHCFFVCGSRIGKPIITAKKQDITDGTDASQMTQTINYFTIHGCQPYPFLIEWDSNKSNQKRHSKRYPPGSQCIFVDNISNATRSNKYQKHQKAKYPNK